MKLTPAIKNFFSKNGSALVSTINDEGAIHCSVKGIVSIDESGLIHMVDLYMNRTYHNLKENPNISVTVVDNEKFMGYTLQGEARIISSNDIEPYYITEWERRIIQRITSRVLRSVQNNSKSKEHFEAQLPNDPKYLIEMQVENIIDLRPTQINEEVMLQNS
jgi:predicted pyridoxine 5'-phosphate oxidase superfamily flavin-nucleotide-binding protein